MKVDENGEEASSCDSLLSFPSLPLLTSLSSSLHFSHYFSLFGCYSCMCNVRGTAEVGQRKNSGTDGSGEKTEEKESASESDIGA